MENTYSETQVAYIVEREGSLVEANDLFLNLSEYKREDLVGKPFYIVWRELLKISITPDLLIYETEAYLFTKSLEVRRIKASLFKNASLGINTYFIEEIPNTRFEDRNEFLLRSIADNKINIAVYSAPDFILLKANQGYSHSLPKPYGESEFAIGKRLQDFDNSFEGSEAERIMLNVIETNQSVFFEEKQGLLTGNENIYWNGSITPISENGKVKYLVIILENVTEHLISKEQLHKQSELIERQREELELKYTQLITILDNLTDAVCLYNSRGEVVFANSTANRYFSKFQLGDPNTAVSSYKYYNGEGNELPYESLPIARALNGERVVSEIVKAVYCKVEYYVDVSAIPIFNSDGVLDFVITINHDITESRRAEEELIEINNRLSFALESVGAGILELDVKSGNQVWSPKLYEIYGIDQSEIMSLDRGLAALHPDDREGAKRSLEEAYNSHSEFWQHVFRIINPKRGIVWIKGTAKIFYDELGNADKHIGINMDISTQKKAEDDLYISESRLSTALKGSPIVAFSQDSELHYTWVYNSSPGFKAEYVLGKRDDEFYPPEDAAIFMGIKRDVLHNGVGRRDEVVTHRPASAGGDLIHDLITEPLRDTSGLIVGVICAAIDITERKKAELERERLQRERNEALEMSIKVKDEFFYLITHEFKTPITVMNSALQAIELIHRKDVTENVGKYLKTIKQNINRQLRLVNNLLDITRINSGYIKLDRGNFDIVRVTKLIVDSVESYASLKKVKLNFNSSIMKKTVHFDEEKYERIMLNLLANALKFTPKEKCINVSLSIKKRQNRNSVCISVRDEGIGIPKDRQHIIFERFGQVDSSLSRQAEGTGLGLHLVKLLVNALDGEITLISKEGKGSTFTVLLPVYEMHELDEIAASINFNEQFSDNDSRIVQAAAIEFSDIYFD